PGTDPISTIISMSCLIGMQVNLFLGIFNMIPIFPLDGSKVLDWDWRVWVAFLVVSGGVYLSVFGSPLG
ncbi:MAG: site-2 protease family protein, partial [Candidatus Micrarchaeota archaeon]